MPVEDAESVLQTTKNNGALKSAVLSCVMLAAFPSPSAHAAKTTDTIFLADRTTQGGGGYFVEFRARRGQYFFGHSFILYGRLNTQGKIVEAHEVGFFPDGDNYQMALFVPVHGLVAGQKSDIKFASTAIYRRYLTADVFQRLAAKVRQIQTANPAYSFLFYDCNNFLGEVAKSIDLKASSSLMLPLDYIVQLRDLNDH